SAVLTGQLNGDEYYGKPLTGAVRIILEARRAVGRGPATIAEIYEQMLAGGYRFNAKSDENAKRALRIALVKASHTFHRIPSSGKFGLLEWYEAIKASKSTGGKDRDDGLDLDDAELADASAEADAAAEEEEEIAGSDATMNGHAPAESSETTIAVLP